MAVVAAAVLHPCAQVKRNLNPKWLPLTARSYYLNTSFGVTNDHVHDEENNLTKFQLLKCKNVGPTVRLPSQLSLPVTKKGDRENPRFFVAVHVGAGFHSPSNEKALRAVMKRACLAAATVLRQGSDGCIDAVSAAIQVLESTPKKIPTRRNREEILD
ncbi:Peptidase T2 [Macleaya cordata]|uniref:Peptidase T2 n=1 Tax=Macleaya cordata TaxID=56857 RepID=A0A200PPX3_MACCD|nr:Peptidase T2 [Macleaya cordata]